MAKKVKEPSHAKASEHPEPVQESIEDQVTPTLLSAIARVEAAEIAEKSHSTEEEALEISAIVSSAASFYEKVRYLVDYREEHTIRRNATERILKRKIFLEGAKLSGIDLIQELVEGAYVPKERATESVINETDRVIVVFAKLIRDSQLPPSEVRHLVSFAASEIDAALSPVQFAVDLGAAEAMYQTIRSKLQAPGVAKETVDLQLYCAVWRSLLRADNESLAYALWNLSVPGWREGKADLDKVAAEAQSTVRAIRAALQNELQWEFVRRIKNESIYFQVIRELLLQKHSGAQYVMERPEKLAIYTRELLEQKFETENQRIKKSGVRAVVYLLCTKLILVGVLEWPYEAFILNDVDYAPLAINAFFHPLLLFALTRRIGFPGKDNTEAVVLGVQNMVHGRVKPLMLKKSGAGNVFAFGLVYLLITVGVFGAIVSILQSLSFNWLGGTLFLFFLALVTYFAFRIRYRANQWRVTRDERALTVLGSVLVTPVIRVGRWLSRSFSSINILVLVMDFILETPFRYLLDFSHQFLRYLREKAEDVY